MSSIFCLGRSGLDSLLRRKPCSHNVQRNCNCICKNTQENLQGNLHSSINVNNVEDRVNEKDLPKKQQRSAVIYA